MVYGDDGELSSVSSGGTTSLRVPLVKIVKPILLPFQGLELQGEDNAVLYAVGNNVNDESKEEVKKRNPSNDDEDDGILGPLVNFNAMPMTDAGDETGSGGEVNTYDNDCRSDNGIIVAV